MTIEQLAAIREDAARSGDLHCLMCNEPHLATILAFQPSEKQRPEYGMRSDSAVTFGLCDNCCFTPQKDVLRVLSLRLVPVEDRN